MIPITEEMFFTCWVATHRKRIKGLVHAFVNPYADYCTEDFNDMALSAYCGYPWIVDQTGGATDIKQKYCPQN